MNVSLAELDFPVRIRPDHPLSDEELMRFCSANELLRVEREKNGDLVLMSPTGTEGSGRNAEITADLTIWARRDGRGKVFDSNGGFTLPDGSMRAADAAWLSWERWNALSAGDQKRFAPVCPEFIIELRSESDRLLELQQKMQQWIANGVRVAWLVDPTRKAVEIYRSGQDPEIIEGTSYVEGDGPVAGFVLELARVWA